MKTNLIILLLLILLTGCTALTGPPPTPTPRPTPTVPPTPTSTWSEETKTEEIEAEVQEIIDDTLPELASYVQQEGQDGEKVTTIEINDQDGTERLVSEEITIEMVPWIIVRGTLTEEETSSLAAEAVEKYFTNIQGGIDSEYHSQAAAQVAGFSITNIQVEDPGGANASKLGKQKGMIRQGPDRNRKLSAITESFVIRVRIPVTVQYEIFGLPFTLNEKWDVTRPPTNTTWTFPTWGIRAATTPGETVTLSENAITLDGIAQTNDSTLIVITTDKRQNTNTATLPSGTQNHFKMINYPRGYTWINETTDKSFPLRIRIESGIIGFGSENHEFNIELMP